MKISPILLGILCFLQFNSPSAMAQKGSISGVYSRSSGNPEGGNTFFVFDDHRFVVAFFGGVFAGKWHLEKDVVTFTPNVPEHQFLVYGRHHKDLKDSSRVFFGGFDEGATYIGFGKNETDKLLFKSVFNPSPNCVGFPIVYQFKGVRDQLLFADQPYGAEKIGTNRPVYNYSNTEKYNDFVAYYIKESRDRRPFFAKVKNGQLFFNDSEKGSPKRPLPTSGEDFNFIQEVLNAPQSVSSVLFNPYYKQSDEDINDTDNWKFDESKNAYINFLNYVEGEERKSKQESDYNRVTVLYQFKLLKLTEKKALPFSVEPNPLFVRNCEERD